MTQNYDRLGGFSFEKPNLLIIDTKIPEQFHKEIPVYTKSKTIEFFIKQFLDKKSSERLAIIFQINSKKTMPLKQGVP